MKARKNPTIEQVARRLRRSPLSCHDPRIKNDPYWALRAQGYPHSYAKRAFRDEPPVYNERTVANDVPNDDYEPDELFFVPGSKVTETEITIRPDLSEAAILALKPRASEYTVWDNDVGRFGVRVRPSGHMSYIVNYRIRYQKKLHKHTIGGVAEFSLEQARDVARSIRRDARMGIDPVMRIREQAERI